MFVFLSSNNLIAKWTEFDKFKETTKLEELLFVGNPIHEAHKDTVRLAYTLLAHSMFPCPLFELTEELAHRTTASRLLVASRGSRSWTVHPSTTTRENRARRSCMAKGRG
jgi:hypothetical protein